MLGALLGSYGNRILPAWVTSCLMAALLLFLTYKLLRRGCTTFARESLEVAAEHRRCSSAPAPADGLTEPLLAHDGGADEQQQQQRDAAARDVDGRPGRARKHGAAPGRAAAAWLSPVSAAHDQDVVLPVPSGLRPLVVHQPGRQAGGEHSSFSVESTPRTGCGPDGEAGASPLRRPKDAAALAAAAAAAAAAESDAAPLVTARARQPPPKLQHEQRRRCCSCLDPARLSLATVRAYQQRQLPWQPLLVMVVLSCWVVASDTAKTTLPCGSPRYWAAVLSVVPPAALTTLLVRQWLLAKTAVEAAAAAAAGPAAAPRLGGGTIHWTPTNSVLYPLCCSMAGVAAGLFGVG